jgi:hypothetical protein
MLRKNVIHDHAKRPTLAKFGTSLSFHQRLRHYSLLSSARNDEQLVHRRSMDDRDAREPLLRFTLFPVEYPHGTPAAAFWAARNSGLHDEDEAADVLLDADALAPLEDIPLATLAHRPSIGPVPARASTPRQGTVAAGGPSPFANPALLSNVASKVARIGGNTTGAIVYTLTHKAHRGYLTSVHRAHALLYGPKAAGRYVICLYDHPLEAHPQGEPRWVEFSCGCPYRLCELCMRDELAKEGHVGCGHCRRALTFAAYTRFIGPCGFLTSAEYTKLARLSP